MKSNKEKICDFIKLHQSTSEKNGVSTSYIAEALLLQRTNVSSALNELVAEGKIRKSNGRPVLYFVPESEKRNGDECFNGMVGFDKSLQHAIKLVKAAVMYPGKCLNILIVGEIGTGKKKFAELIYEYSVSQKIIPETGEFLRMNCRDYRENGTEARKVLFGDNEEGILKKAEGGVLYFDNIQFLEGVLIREISSFCEKDERKGLVIASCTPGTEPHEEEFQNAFPVIVTLPTLSERPTNERMEMIRALFQKEALRIGKKLLVKDEVIKRLLLYECPENIRQLKRDIKVGCANAYVREMANESEITLYVSDFESSVRAGMTGFGEMRDAVNSLIPENCIFSFDGTRVSTSKNVKDNIYTELFEKAKRLEAEGIENDDIKTVLGTEIERNFGKYRNTLTGDIRTRKELELIVDKELIDLVEGFLKKAETEKNAKFSDSVFLGLCLHMKNVLTGKSTDKTDVHFAVTEVIARNKREYMLSTEFAEKIYKVYKKRLSTDEIIFITMFLCYEPEKTASVSHPAVLYAFYGKGVAESIVKTIREVGGFENVFSFEVLYRQSTSQIYEALKKCISEIDKGSGVFIVYDSDAVSKIAGEIAEETGIMIRLFPMPVTTMGVELARKAMISGNLDSVYRETIKNVCEIANFSKKYIITLCTTGKGGAEELKNYIEKYGNLDDVSVVPLSMADRNALNEKFREIMRNGSILLVIGTFNPKLYSIPFCSVSELFSTPKERLNELLVSGASRDYEVDYDDIFAYLSGQFKCIDIKKAENILKNMISEINRNLKHMSRDTEIGLLIHTACCAERLSAGEKSPVNLKKKEIMYKYEREFKTLLKLLKPIEKTYHIIFNDDEVSNMLMIIYQL